MIYNLSPILTLLTERVPAADTWRNRFISFFNNKDYDGDLRDWYYDKLLNNIREVQGLLENGYFVDPYSGLFSFPSPYIEATHSFNIAYFLSSHHQHFFGKKILTVCSDFGILNIQIKLCGLDVVSSVQKEYLNTGTVLTCIGNDSPPYPINRMLFPEEDVVIMSCVFQDDDLTYKNWEFMIDKKAEGKEVFFTSNSYFYLRRYMNYDKIELIVDPKEAYNSEDYADISYGYMNKIYRLK
jgi:hypothetical protein